MIRLRKKKTEITAETIVNTIWISTFLALILTIPPICVFLGIYFTTSNLLAGAVIGFGLHFTILAFSDRVSKRIIRILS
jgi:hypothetical protein